jgi:acyl-CoA thioesterase
MSDNHEHTLEGGEATTTDLLPSFFSQPTSDSFGIAHLLGMQFVRGQDGIGQIRIAVDKRLMHPQQMVHGGVIFTLADTAMSLALASVIPPGTPFGTIEAKINYLLPVREGELLAEGKVVHLGGTTAVMEATVYNSTAEQKRAIAQVLGTFYIRRAKSTQNNNNT